MDAINALAFDICRTILDYCTRTGITVTVAEVHKAIVMTMRAMPNADREELTTKAFELYFPALKEESSNVQDRFASRGLRVSEDF